MPAATICWFAGKAMEGASALLAGSFTKGSRSVLTSGWRAIGQDTSRTSHRSKVCSFSRSLKQGFDRRASGRRICSTGGARQVVPSIFACLESLDSDNELLSLQNHLAAMYDHFDIHEARLEHELKLGCVRRRILSSKRTQGTLTASKRSLRSRNSQH